MKLMLWKKKKGEVKADLKVTLQSYLETIEVFYPDDEEEESVTPEGVIAEEPEDYDELFQTIEINDDGSIASGDMDKLNDSPVHSSASIDEEVLESLLGDEDAGETGDDVFSLKDMFSLETGEDKKDHSS